MIVGSFFVMNLWAGVMVDSFHEQKERLGGLSDLNEQQKEWIEIQMRVYDTQPVRRFMLPRNELRRRVCKVVEHRYFEMLIMFLIVLNTIVFLFQWERQPQFMDDFILYCNLFFLTIFVVEFALHMVASPVAYFSSSFNLFDFLILLLSIVGSLLDYLQLIDSYGTATSVFRTFRIVRVLRLSKSAQSIRLIFKMFFYTLP